MIKSEHLSCSENNSQMNSKITQSRNKKSPTSQNKQRRSRCDNVKREHLCGCGKGYLSAAALYTHVKQKHDGMTPLGSILPSTVNEKNLNKKEASEFGEDRSLAVDKQLQFEKNCPDIIYQEICAFFMRFYPSSSQSSSQQQGLDWISVEFPRHIFLRSQDFEGILSSLEDLQKRLTFQQSIYLPHQVPSTSTGKSETQFTGKQPYEEDACFSDSGVSANHLTKIASNLDKKCCEKKAASEDQNDIDNKNHSEINKNINQHEDGQEQPCFMHDTQLPNSEWNLDFYDFQRELRITSIDNIFAIFIANLNSKICKEAVLEVATFLILLRKILNDCGEEICSSQLPLCTSQNEQNEFQCNIKIEDNDKDDSNQPKGEFCATNCGQNLAEIANVFISKCQDELFKETFTERWSKDFKFLGENDEGLKNMCLLLRLLILWMNVFKFTDSTLEFNQEEEEKDENICEESKKQLKGNEDCPQIQQQEKKSDEEACETGIKGGEEVSLQENSRKLDFDEDPMLRDEQEGQLEEQAMLANLSSGFSLTKPSESSQYSYQSSYGNILSNSNKLAYSTYDQNGNYSLTPNLQLSGYNLKSNSFYNQNNINPFAFNNYFKSNRNSTTFAMQEQIGKINAFGNSETPRSLSSAPFFKPSQFAFYNSITPTAAGSVPSYPSGYALCSPYAAIPINSNSAFEFNLMQQQQLQQLQILNQQQQQQYSKQYRNLEMNESSFA